MLRAVLHPRVLRVHADADRVDELPGEQFRGCERFGALGLVDAVGDFRREHVELRASGFVSLTSVARSNTQAAKLWSKRARDSHCADRHHALKHPTHAAPGTPVLARPRARARRTCAMSRVHSTSGPCAAHLI
eukprot:1993945-Rhodomonas_salina.5